MSAAPSAARTVGTAVAQNDVVIAVIHTGTDGATSAGPIAVPTAVMRTGMAGVTSAGPIAAMIAGTPTGMAAATSGVMIAAVIAAEIIVTRRAIQDVTMVTAPGRAGVTVIFVLSTIFSITTGGMTQLGGSM